MSRIQRTNMHWLIRTAIVSLVVAHVLAQNSPLLNALLPKIDQEYYYLEPEEHGYRLQISAPPGSKRDEVVELKQLANGEQELSLNGTQTLQFIDTNGVLTVMYVAGKNGYTVRFKYEIVPAVTQYSLSITALKSGAGG